VVDRVDAKKRRLSAREALALVREVDEIYAMRGKKLVHFDLTRSKPTRDELLAVLLGPSGNLRAPTIRTGRTLLVGFDESTYRKVLG
jgi:arsenate reductase-like glutaredoxin family protein